ncbi:Protein of unknown function DUF2373 [Cinara cedri]|uniref:WKF domain-containing protein n=1 Tax=Cinara cedri TaxID=506608 RepID=A0A5E4M6G9_9HEMI|nr:Protein of unknown function DUF2373 [Cinara cedri]
MSIKSVLKKKFKLENTIFSMKKKKPKIKHVISKLPGDIYTKLNTNNDIKCESVPDNLQKRSTTPIIKIEDGNHIETTDIDKIKNSTPKIKKKRKSETNEHEMPKKKKVTFASDVKSEKDQKCTAGNMLPLSLNKRKKLNYIKKLKSKKNKQKNAKKCEANIAATSTPLQERAIAYMIQWKNDRSNWKFNKKFQIWLIKNTYDPVKIPKEHFDILVEYLQTINGQSRNLILQNANTIVTESSASDEHQELNLAQENKYQRARTIIQMFV